MADTYFHWRQENLRDEDGIVVASDQTHEWLLPWWWDHYRKYNDHPVVFVDFGLSLKAKNWCKERGEFALLPVPDIFVKEKQEIDPLLSTDWELGFGNKFWPSRNAWFKKPLACLRSPFRRTIWLDIDCEIRGSIQKLFDYADRAQVGLVRERSGSLYNSGVIVFRHGISLIEQWAKESFEKNHLFRGDQEILSNMIKEKKLDIEKLPEIYNWSRLYEDNPDALVLHWHGDPGHGIIRYRIWYAQDSL
jgi:hypothetical protein